MRDYNVGVRAHGRHQLEIKNKYPLSGKQEVQYLLYEYFFIPGQLNITSETYGIKAFYQDMKANTRFSIANLPLSKIIDPACPVSPLTRIRNYLNELTLNDDTLEKLLHYELRVLAKLYRGELKANFQLLRRLRGGDKIKEISRFLKGNVRII